MRLSFLQTDSGEADADDSAFYENEVEESKDAVYEGEVEDPDDL